MTKLFLPVYENTYIWENFIGDSSWEAKQFSLLYTQLYIGGKGGCRLVQRKCNFYPITNGVHVTHIYFELWKKDCFMLLTVRLGKLSIILTAPHGLDLLIRLVLPSNLIKGCKCILLFMNGSDGGKLIKEKPRYCLVFV